MLLEPGQSDVYVGEIQTPQITEQEPHHQIQFYISSLTDLFDGVGESYISAEDTVRIF